MAKVKISELPSLSPATLDTTYVVGISGSTTYKISINQLTSSLDTTFATDLVTAALSSSLNSKLSTSSYSTDSSSFNSRIISGSAVAGTISSSAQITALGFISTSTDLSALNTISASYLSFTQSYYTTSASVDSRLDRLETYSGSYTGSLTGSVFGIGDVAVFSSSVDSRIKSGSAVAGTISGSAQISALGYATTSSVTTISASAWGAFQSASSYSSSLATSIATLSSSVDSRLDTLEVSVITGSANYVQVLGNRVTGVTTTGVTLVSGSITTSGNPVQIMVTGDANPVGGTSYTRLQIYRDSTPIGNYIQVENGANLNVPYCLNVIDTASAGTYTYSMRTVSVVGGTLDFGEGQGPVLTAVELKTNTNLPSLNNTFTGTNTFNGVTKFGTVGGDEGGEIEFGVPQTNTSLSTRVVADVYQNRLRIFDGNTNGVFIDLSKAPTGVAGEIAWKTSGFVNAGTFLTLDNLKVTCTTTGNRGLSIGAVSTNFTANVAGWFGYTNGGGGQSAATVTYTTSAATSAFGWSFPAEGDTSNYIITDKTNSRVYRVILVIGASYLNNFISIERLH